MFLLHKERGWRSSGAKSAPYTSLFIYVSELLSHHVKRLPIFVDLHCEVGHQFAIFILVIVWILLDWVPVIFHQFRYFDVVLILSLFLHLFKVFLGLVSFQLQLNLWIIETKGLVSFGFFFFFFFFIWFWPFRLYGFCFLPVCLLICVLLRLDIENWLYSLV